MFFIPYTLYTYSYALYLLRVLLYFFREIFYLHEGSGMMLDYTGLNVELAKHGLNKKWLHDQLNLSFGTIAKFAKGIEVSWHEFRTLLTYKTEWYGRELIIAPSNYASSQLCHVCGYKNVDVKNLGLRAWKCPCWEIVDIFFKTTD